jgi:CheY-like chemotaxis protein
LEKFKKVLLIDDDEIVNSINKVIIQHAKFASEITSKTFAGDAIDYLKGEQSSNDLPDIIFLDVNMPEMDGWDFIDEFEKLDLNTTKPKIVMLTSSINPRDEQRANAARQVTAFISKPLSPELLDSIYTNYLS